jgi:hypothetical protein
VLVPDTNSLRIVVPVSPGNPVCNDRYQVVGSTGAEVVKVHDRALSRVYWDRGIVALRLRDLTGSIGERARWR